MGRKPKNKKAYLRKKADRLLQQKYVPLNPICIVCGAQTSEMHHVVYKSQSSRLRYAEGNLVPLCVRCHARHHLSGDAIILATIIKKRGQDWFDALQHIRNDYCKTTIGAYEQTIERLEKL